MSESVLYTAPTTQSTVSDIHCAAIQRERATIQTFSRRILSSALLEILRFESVLKNDVTAQFLRMENCKRVGR